METSPDMVGQKGPPSLAMAENAASESTARRCAATSMPSFRSSPWIRGAPQDGVRGSHANDQGP